MGMKSKYNFSNQCYNNIVKLIIDLIPVKHNMLKDLYQSKKIVVDLGMNYEKIDICERNCMLFWKEHKDDTECMDCDRPRYVKVVNEDEASVTIKVVVKQLRYMPITLRLKWLYLSEETVKQMRWLKEWKRDSEDLDIMSHPKKQRNSSLSNQSHQSRDDQTDETLRHHEEWMQYIVSMMQVNIFKYAIFLIL
jgi:hypothetical protein